MNFVHEAAFSYPTGREAELRALSGLNYALSYGLGFGSSRGGTVRAVAQSARFDRVIWDIWNFHLNQSDFTSALKVSARRLRLG